MDDWEAPQWADFNATVRSDVEDFFQTEHETHERKRSSDSFDESMDSSIADDASRSNCSSPMPKNNSSRSTRSNFSIPIPKSNFSTPTAKSNFSSSAPKSIGNFSTPVAKSMGNFSSPVPKSMGNFSSLVPKSVDNFSSPVQKSVGNFSSPVSKSMGNFSSLVPKSVDNFSSPVQKSVGNFSSPVSKSMGNFSSPVAKSLCNFSSSVPKGGFSSPVPKKMGNFSSPIPSRVSRSGVKKGGEIFSSAIDSLRPNSEKKIRASVGGVAQGAVEASSSRGKNDCESEKKIEENFVYRENVEEETGENNRTLVAEDAVESRHPIVETGTNEEFDRAEDKLAIRDGEENLDVLKLDSEGEISEGAEDKTGEARTKEESRIRLELSKRSVETKKSRENLPAKTEISTLPENKSGDKLEDKSEDKSGDKSDDKSGDKSEDKSEEKSADKSEDKFSGEKSKLDKSGTFVNCPVVEKKEENLRISGSAADSEMIALSGNKSEDKISAAEKSKLVKLVSQLDPPKRSISENKPGDKISGQEKSKFVKLVSQLDPSKRPISEKKFGDKISGDEKLKLAKLISQLDPPKRTISESKSGNKISGESTSNLVKPISQTDPSKLPVGDKKNPSSRAPAKSRVLACQVRRYSLSKHRRRSNQYVSLAEAVSKFQTGTPKRFRSTNRKDDKAGPVQKTKQTAVKLTCPMSPALLCKFRSRAVSVPNAEEREKLEIDEIRKNRVRPNPIKTGATVRRPTKGPRTQSDSAVTKNSRAFSQATKSTLNRQTSTEKKNTVETKTLPEPTASSSEIKTAMDPPKGTTRIVKKPSDHAASIKATSTSRANIQPQIVGKFAAPADCAVPAERRPEAHLMSTSISKHTPRKKMIPSLVSTEDGHVMKNVEILHFGIPINYKNKNITRTMPFSFDSRNKDSQSRKEKTKCHQSEEDKSRKSTFHARPAPAFAKAAPAVTPKPKDDNPSKPMLCPLSFQERNELLLQKKKRMIEEAVEKERKARVFHAKPAPALRPVFVRGASAENLRASSNSVDCEKRKSRGLSPAARQRGLSQDSVVSNQENKAPNLPQPVMQCPKLKNPLMGQNLVIKKTGGAK